MFLMEDIAFAKIQFAIFYKKTNFNIDITSIKKVKFEQFD